MEWYTLAMILSLGLSYSVKADCSRQCSACSSEGEHTDTHVDPLVCALECEGSLLSQSEWEKCKEFLKLAPEDLSSSDSNTVIDPEYNVERQEQQPLSNDQFVSLVKRYGGFLKKIGKNKPFTRSLTDEDSNTDENMVKRYGGFFRKFGERAAPDITENSQEVKSASENEDVTYDMESPNNSPLKEFKRYGGFLRKWNPKRSADPGEEGIQVQEELQKRYGGFMRRIRPKIRWDNQKRYGGFLRRHFKITVRSDEDPTPYLDEFLDL
ncbi:proenkephalin-B [Protopterus annectens]|uniref:proenkephalin-B n=1 Tax=Protopterus annectens TaxID=7888 RepID=UPI001CF99D04|nr:proenkephalin-B [Protopterus annectens]XP_043945810.1 proenkephalin-B [Protopterus annectens]XP_043945811.1 proenkephalin-B [Protopterus annectens]